mgnify:CR=1 FL=1
MVEVMINGFVWFFDFKTKILYEDREKTKGTPMSFMTKNEMEQLEKEIRFPRKKVKELV